MAQFRKKPVVIEAVQLCYNNWPAVCEFLGDAVGPDNPAWNIPKGEESDACGESGDGPGFIALNVTTTHGEIAVVRHGDWIIQDSKPGTFYPCKPDVFATTYQRLEEEGKIAFGAAVEAAKKGHKIARAGWNGKGMWLILFSQSMFITVDIEEGELEPGQVISLEEHGYSSHIGDVGTGIEHIGITSDDGKEFYPISDFFLLKTADNKCVPWNASQSDMLADDWVILPK